MSFRFTRVLFLAALIPTSACQPPRPEIQRAGTDALFDSYLPPEGFVPDSATAARVAEAVTDFLAGGPRARFAAGLVAGVAEGILR